MHHRFYFFLASLILVSPPLVSQERPSPVSLVRLIANPQEFDGKSVLVRGFFLAVTQPHDISAYFLFLHKEDAENNLGNDIEVVASENMIKDLEKLDRMYVQLIGTLHAVRISGTDAYALSMRDITSYVVWSDPNHPIALKLLDQKRK